MQTSPIPGTESWPERYGLIGSVALIALVALAWSIRNWLRDRDLERERLARNEAENEKIIAALNAKLVEVVRENHKETLQLVMVRNSEHEQRFQALLQRHMDDTQRSASVQQSQNAALTEAFSMLTRKLTRGPD